MAISRCSVSFTDNNGIVHTTHIEAESLYEAIAVAVAEFRRDHLVPSPAPATEFTVAIERPRIEHHIRLSQVQKWAQHTTRDGPAGVARRNRMRTLLGQS